VKRRTSTTRARAPRAIRASSVPISGDMSTATTGATTDHEAPHRPRSRGGGDKPASALRRACRVLRWRSGCQPFVYMPCVSTVSLITKRKRIRNTCFDQTPKGERRQLGAVAAGRSDGGRGGRGGGGGGVVERRRGRRRAAAAGGGARRAAQVVVLRAAAPAMRRRGGVPDVPWRGAWRACTQG
jgi:hypothetical protein